MADMRTIKVTGKGKISVKPDMTRLTITLEGTCKDYGLTLKRTSEDTEKLRDLVGGLKFKKEDLKTINFNVDTDYESYEEDGVYKQRFTGYRYIHVLKLEFDSDNERLGQLLFALAASDLHPEFRISYTVKDREAAKNELLGNAVKDAAEKAKILADAAGVTLKEIRNINYSWGEIDLDVHPMNLMCERSMKIAPAAGAYDLNIEPDDIEVSDTVTVVWEIA